MAEEQEWKDEDLPGFDLGQGGRIALLKEGPSKWNAWREKRSMTKINLYPQNYHSHH